MEQISQNLLSLALLTRSPTPKKLLQLPKKLLQLPKKLLQLPKLLRWLLLELQLVILGIGQKG